MAPELNELEQKGAALFERMGLLCAAHLADAQLTAINPGGSYRKGEHLEVDYLLPQNDVCLVGEITDRAAGSCPDKLKTFQRHLNVIDHALKAATNQTARSKLWRTLGVSEECLPSFRNVRSLRGFAILTKIEECEIPAHGDLSNCAVMYRYH